jgi:hypothetical protein
LHVEDPRLGLIVAIWDSLAEDVRARMLALADGSASTVL